MTKEETIKALLKNVIVNQEDGEKNIEFHAKEILKVIEEYDKKNSYTVDGIIFKRDGEILVMDFKVADVKHSFRIQQDNAILMTKVLKQIYPAF